MLKYPPYFIIIILTSFLIGCGQANSRTQDQATDSSSSGEKLESLLSGPSRAPAENPRIRQQKIIEQQKRLQEKRMKSYVDNPPD